MELRAAVADVLFVIAETIEDVGVLFRRASQRLDRPELRHPAARGVLCRWCAHLDHTHDADGRCVGRITVFEAVR